jgi:5-methylcytosine-specific restriction enzyme subunit McrC
MRHWALVEWGELRYGTASDEIPEQIAVQLAHAAQAAGLSRRHDDVLQLGRTSLRARQTVGLIVADGATLEILPKIAGRAEGAAREQLVHMLAVAYDLPLAVSGSAAVSTQRNSLLEIVIERFATGLRTAVRKGLPHRYLSVAEDLPALRGKLQTVRQFTTLATSPHRLACEYDEYSADTPLNQVIKAAVHKLLRFTTRARNARLLKELTTRYAAVSYVPEPALPWDQVKLDRTNQRWHQVFALAKLLLGNDYQSTTSGKTNGITLLFEMNILFERYIAVQMSKALAGSTFSTSTQGGLRHCLTDQASGRSVFRTRPDIMLHRDGQVALVVDTKWKHIAEKEIEINQSDIYQMMAYAQVYQCSHVILLYPHAGDFGKEEGIQATYQVANSESEISVWTVDVSSQIFMRERLMGLVVQAIASQPDTRFQKKPG